MVTRRSVFDVALIALLLAACSSEPRAVGDSSVATTHTTQPRRPTTTRATTTEASTTSLASTTTTVALPVPEPPPVLGVTEPSIELGTIEIPRLGLNSSLLEGIALSTLDQAPGHWPGTAMPGMIGNVVVGGHRVSHLKPFRHLEQLLPGDEVIFTTDAGRFVYHVTQTQIVTPDSMWIVDQTNAYTGTLFACNPPGKTTERIVVFLQLAG